MILNCIAATIDSLSFILESAIINASYITATMSLSTENRLAASGSVVVKGQTICVVPDFSSGHLEDEFDLNRSYPCTRRPLYKERLLALQRRYDPASLTGKFQLC